ncbi:menaquinone biosynthetic enzyme MqnA/MqnD family protein [Phycisphaerales bacterium AB-hyl4]|uniref:Chorismate dehydratase n=1 Tax=Natronomicrosphaera hydrolytica TaxID=3242702 RepID=A0ABV4U121_9BACT
MSYLNARPLIEGLDGDPTLQVRFDVPAGLLHDLETGQVDLALCPVVDYFRSAEPLVIVPVGGIASEGRTLTVRLFSKTPIDQVDVVHADTDSHTSVVLLQVLLHAIHGRRPTLIDYHAREHVAGHRLAESPEAMLLIGDKVVTDSPRAIEYPYQLDLGEAWHELTDLPFLFAVWMARKGTDLGELPAHLDRQRQINARDIDAIARRHAPGRGWPSDLAYDYLANILRYSVSERELAAVRRLAEMANPLGLLPNPRPLTLAD